ncbi:MAG: baseplate J/gp47 family protein [Candidatus Margulisbacteria bacterium]|nr:baseplate J/gp47 family protein [Candidatus Margulisiibacteriota bacterium]
MVYNSQYPLTSNGVSLDHISSITGVTRLLSTHSKVKARVYGDIGSEVPSGFIVSVLGNEDSKFETKYPNTIHQGVDDIQNISFDRLPSSGTFKLNYNGQDTISMDHESSNTDIQNNLNTLNGLSEVIVTGNFVSGFVVSFIGTDGQKPHKLLTVSENAFLEGINSVEINITKKDQGEPPFVDMEMIAQETGPIHANTNTLTEIETPVSGIDSATNIEDARLGRNIESDSELKIRRLELLQRRGTATIEGIRNMVLSVQDVIQAIIVENSTFHIDEGGRPPKSFEIFVVGGSDQEIANSIFMSKPAGIETVGDISMSVIDSQGAIHTIKFSRVLEKDIFIEVRIKGNSDPSEGNIYPSNGDYLVEESLLSFLRGFKIGQDIIVNLMYSPINTVPGITGVDILMGLSPNPISSDNIAISGSEIARFDSSRIEVVS